MAFTNEDRKDLTSVVIMVEELVKYKEDHEKRLRAVEKAQWKISGVIGLFSSFIGAAMTHWMDK